MNSKVLTIANNKGGCGKTLMTMLIADYAAKQGKKVLVIDLDPQGNTSRRFTDMELFTDDDNQETRPFPHPDYDKDDKEFAVWEDGRSTSADIWLAPYIYYPYPSNRHENIDILPVDSSKLQKIESVKKSQLYLHVLLKMKKFIQMPGVSDSYDLIIMDTRPSKGPITSAAITGATHLLIPSEMEAASIEGLVGILGLCKISNASRDKGDNLEIIGILPNRINKQANVHKHHLESLKDNPVTSPYILPYSLSGRIGYAEIMNVGNESLFDKVPSNKLRKEAVYVCEKILNNIFKNG